MSTSKHLAVAAATAASILAAAPPGAAASGFACSASPLSGTLLGQIVEPARAGSDQACEPSSRVVAPLPVPLAGDSAAARTGEADGRAQAAAWLSGLKAGSLRSPARQLPQVPLPAGIGALQVRLGPAAQLLGLPASITVDATGAARRLVSARALPDVPLLGADLVRTAVGGVCEAGNLALRGLSMVDGLTALGAPVPTDRPVDTSVPLVPADVVDFSKLDVGGIALPGGLSLADPVVGPVLRAALESAAADLPTASVPAAVGRVTVEPARQDGWDGALRQLGPRVTVDVLGQRLVDLILGDALVSGVCAAAADPVAAPQPAPAAVEALQCADSDVVLTDVHEHHGRVKLLGVAASRFVGRTVDLVLTHTGRTVATAVVQPDGSFLARAALPATAIRWTNHARYQAVIGRERSMALKLHRRMRITRMRAAGGALTIAGRVHGPMTGDDVVISRRVSCTHDRVVTSVKPGRDGRWRVRLRLPEGVDAATYRATTSVRDEDGPKRFRTFTLPGYVSL